MRAGLVLMTAAALWVVACAHGQVLTQQELDAHATRSYAAPMAKVFPATENALRAQGYDIAVSDPAKGTIKTKRKFVRAVARREQDTAAAIELTRQYLVHVEETAAGQTRVIALPRVYAGEDDLSEKGVWDLEGPVGERRLWSNLFREIQDGL